MARLEASQLINRSVEDVFAFLTAPANHPKFVPGMLEFQQTSAGAFGQVGATARGVRRDFGQRRDLPYEVIEFQPQKRLAMKGSIGGIAFRDGYTLESRGTGTRVGFWLEVMPNGVLRLAQPLIALIGRAHASETLGNLKRVLETSR
jgi:hypothetical protein